MEVFFVIIKTYWAYSFDLYLDNLPLAICLIPGDESSYMIKQAGTCPLILIVICFLIND